MFTQEEDNDFIELAKQVPREVVRKWIYDFWPEIEIFHFIDDDYVYPVVYWESDTHICTEYYGDPSAAFVYKVMKWHMDNKDKK